MSGPFLSRALLAAASLVLLALVGCGGGEEPDGPLHGARVTVYSSMPLEGPDRAAALDVVNAQQLALREHGGAVGRYRVNLVSLDAATPTADRWDPAQISKNARLAAGDPAAIAYLGEFHSGSSAISIPILNEAGIAQLSPMDTAMELTTGTTAVTGSPERYYPNSEKVGRTFARVVPSDRVQAVAQARYMKRTGVRRLALLTDDDPTGVAFATAVRQQARKVGIAIAGRENVDPNAKDQRDLVTRIRATRADAVFYAGGPHDGAELLWRQLALTDPAIKLFVPAELVDGPFIARIGVAARSTYVTRPVLPLASYPPLAQRFAAAFEARYGRAPLPEALFGYTAMQAVLAALRRAAKAAGDAPLTRTDVAREVLRTRRPDSVVGPYAIVHSGDTTLTTYGAYRIRDGELRFVGRLLR